VDPDWRGLIGGARLSRDGSRLTYDIRRPDGQVGVEVKELDLGPRQLLTGEGTTGIRPTWTADGDRIVFVGVGTSVDRSFDVRRADAATGAERFLPVEEGLAQEIEFSPDGRWVVIRIDEDMYLWSTEGDSDPEPLFADPAYFEGNFAISPDGQWITYTSEETGEYRVYVSPFPNVSDGRTIVSLNAGTSPRWSPDGGELYYRERGGGLLAAKVVVAGDDFRIGEREVLFETSGIYMDPNHASYDVHPDGRFIMSMLGSSDVQDGLIVVENFAQEIEGRGGGRWATSSSRPALPKWKGWERQRPSGAEGQGRRGSSLKATTQPAPWCRTKTRLADGQEKLGPGRSQDPVAFAGPWIDQI
jgi:hypothetical protein